MGIFGDVVDTFTGGGSDTSQESTLLPEQRRLLNWVMPYLKKFQPVYPSNKVATTPSKAENLSLHALEQAALDSTKTGHQAALDANKALMGILTQKATDFQDYYKQTVFNPAVEEFKKTTLPTVRNQFADQYFSGERRQAESDQVRSLNKDLLAQRADLAFKTREADRDAKLRALGLTSDVIGAEGKNASELNRSAALIDAVRQGRLDKKFDRFKYTWDSVDRRYGRILEAAGLNAAENITTTDKSGGLLGGIKTGLDIWKMFP